MPRRRVLQVQVPVVQARGLSSAACASEIRACLAKIASNVAAKIPTPRRTSNTPPPVARATGVARESQVVIPQLSRISTAFTEEYCSYYLPERSPHFVQIPATKIFFSQLGIWPTLHTTLLRARTRFVRGAPRVAQKHKGDTHYGTFWSRGKGLRSLNKSVEPLSGGTRH